jgi:urease accessory protein
VGRRARLELVFALRHGRTVLRHAYAEPPLRAGRPFHERGGRVQMIMASSAPGIFGGDCLTEHVVVERGARVRLTSQSAVQVHPSPEGDPALRSSTYEVEDDAELECEWDPLIPFAGARLEQRIRVGLAGQARLYWSDALMCGRAASGERWMFADLSHDLRVTRTGRLEYVERYRVTPLEGPASRARAVRNASYFGTILSSGQLIEPDRAAELHGRLSAIDGIRSAVDRLESALVLVRLIGDSGAAFREARAIAKNTRSV